MASFNYPKKQYVVLPATYFYIPGMKPPLVRESWLKKVSDELEENTSLLLIAQEMKFQTNLVTRKRGRPKKQAGTQNPVTEQTAVAKPLIENVTENFSNPDVCDSNDMSNFWNSAKLESPEFESKQSEEFSKSEKYDDNKLTNISDCSSAIFRCPDCRKVFKALSTLKYHLRIHRGGLLNCKECGRGFMTKYLLKCHERIHTGELFMCEKCNRGFTTAELLKVHRRRHTGEKPFACDQCTKRFPTASNLTQHKETHLVEKKYLCAKCGVSFNQRRCLYSHMLVHSDKSHTCSVCGKQWVRKSDLVEHMRVHTRERPFHCNLCEHTFTQASSLKRHVLTHQVFDPQMCRVCGKVLRCQVSYQRHLRRHQKTLPIRGS